MKASHYADFTPRTYEKNLKHYYRRCRELRATDMSSRAPDLNSRHVWTMGHHHWYVLSPFCPVAKKRYIVAIWS